MTKANRKTNHPKSGVVLRKAHNASDRSAGPQSGFLLQYRTDKIDHLPSRSISKTLIASCVLSGRTSLAGSVCLLWIPGETEGGDCIGLMKGCAATADIIRLDTSPTKTNGSCLLLSRSSRITSAGPCEEDRAVCVRIYRDSSPRCESTADLHLNI